MQRIDFRSRRAHDVGRQVFFACATHDTPEVEQQIGVVGILRQVTIELFAREIGWIEISSRALGGNGDER